jgi:hypothetical protein
VPDSGKLVEEIVMQLLFGRYSIKNLADGLVSAYIINYYLTNPHAE